MAVSVWPSINIGETIWYRGISATGIGASGPGGGVGGDILLLEDGDDFLLESGDTLELE